MTPNELIWPPTDNERRSMIVLHRVLLCPQGSTLDQATGATRAMAHIDLDDVYTSILLIIPPNLIQDEFRRALNLDYDMDSDTQTRFYADFYGNFLPPAEYGEPSEYFDNAGVTLNVIGLRVRPGVPNDPSVPYDTDEQRDITEVPVANRSLALGRRRRSGGSTTSNISSESQSQPQPKRQPRSAKAVKSIKKPAAVTTGPINENRRVTRSQKRKAEEQLEAESSTAAQKRKIEKQPEVKPSPRRKLVKPRTAAQKEKVVEQPSTATQEEKVEEQPSTATQEEKVEEQPEAEPSTLAQEVKVEKPPTRTAAEKGKQKESLLE